MSYINFGKINTPHELIETVSELPVEKATRDKIIDTLYNPSDYFSKTVEWLGKIGLSEADASRILRYKDGRYKLTNNFYKYHRERVDNLDDYKVIDEEYLNSDEFLNANDVSYIDVPEGFNGLVTPVYFHDTGMFLLQDSEFFLLAKRRILVTRTLHDAIDVFSGHSVQGGNIMTLVKYLPPDIDFIIERSTQRVYNISLDVIELVDPRMRNYRKVLEKLDMIRQPYPVGFGFRDDMLKQLLKHPSVLDTVNRTFLDSDMRRGASKIFSTLGLQICQIPTISLMVHDNGAVMDDWNNENSYRLLEQCPRNFAVLVISKNYSGRSRHDIMLIFNTVIGKGYLFDPSYDRSNLQLDNEEVAISRFLRRRLSRTNPGSEILTSNTIPCPYLYSFQSNIGDLYCASWSHYIALLYLLNYPEFSFEDVVDYIYNLGKENFPIVIARFILAFVPDRNFVSHLIDTEIRTGSRMGATTRARGTRTRGTRMY